MHLDVIRRIGARWWLSFLITVWGACVLGMGFVHDWKVLTVLRAFLGVFEAGKRTLSACVVSSHILTGI
jgi:MFS family permease